MASNGFVTVAHHDHDTNHLNKARPSRVSQLSHNIPDNLCPECQIDFGDFETLPGNIL